MARRFRVGLSTLRLWRKQAREEGRRAPLRMGRGPAPLGGKLEALAELVAGRNDATLVEYADMLAARTGEPKRSAQALIPVLLRTRPDAVVVMDNLAAHKAAVVRKALDAAGIGYRYLPAYSPDMNPIELAWSKLKAYLRTRAARSREALERAIPDALATITPGNARGWFRHAGYPPN